MFPAAWLTGSAHERQYKDLDSRYDPLPRLREVLEDPQADVFDVEAAGQIAVNTDADSENHKPWSQHRHTSASRGGCVFFVKLKKTLQSICQRSQMKLWEKQTDRLEDLNDYIYSSFTLRHWFDTDRRTDRQTSTATHGLYLSVTHFDAPPALATRETRVSKQHTDTCMINYSSEMSSV